MRVKMTKKLLLGNRAVYVAIMDIRMDMVVTRKAYKRPHDNLSHNIRSQNHIHPQIRFIQSHSDWHPHQNAVS